MAFDITSDDFVAKPSDVPSQEEEALRAAHAQALAELNQLQAKASTADNAMGGNANYSMHDVANVGRYVIPRRSGWNALLDIIHDPVPNIDFSANIYPAFDGIIGEHFESPYLLDPLDDKYESYESLRDNLAAVRNFLMESYYATDKSGLSPVQAKQALAEIAAFVGDGLYNNFLFGGMIPNHDPNQPHIDIDQARAKGGHGAQYIYERILAHQRQSDWLRPFDAVVALFGGNPQPNWKLPDADKTHFTDFFDHDIAGALTSAPQNTTIEAAAANLAAIEAQLNAARDARLLTTSAQDLDFIGNNLVYTANHLDGVAQMSAPVRRDAVEIAKEILRKLKLSIGEAHVVDGLNMKPSDDMAALGAVKGVATVYARLLAWARNNNDSAIFQHPSVIAATQAIGQLGYLAKAEALRMANVAKNSALANNLSEQLNLLPASFKPVPGTKFGQLLDTIQSGMEVILNRTQEVSVTGGKVGYSVDGNLGTSLHIDPTAGLAGQTGVESVIERNAKAMAADQLIAQAQAADISAQLATQARTAQNSGKPTAPAPAQPAPRGGTVGRAALNAARTQQQRQASSNSTPSSATPINPGQQMAAQRANASAALARAARERAEHEHHEHELLRQQQLLNQQKAANAAKAKATVGKIDPNMLKGFKSATSLQGVTGPVVTGGRPIDPKSIQATVNKPTSPTTPKPAAPGDDVNNPYLPQPPRGPGRGF